MSSKAPRIVSKSQSNVEFSYTDETKQDLISKIKEYNEALTTIPENYKSIKPNGGKVLVKVAMDEQPQEYAQKMNDATGSTRIILDLSFAQPALGNKGWGIVVSDDYQRSGFYSGDKVLLKLETFFRNEGGQLYPHADFIFGTPEHNEVGFYLVPMQLIECSF